MSGDIGVGPEGFGARLVGPDDDLVATVAAHRRNHPGNRRIGIDRADQTITDIRYRVAGLRRVGERRAVDLGGVIGIRLDRSANRDLISLVSKAFAFDNRLVIAAAEVDLFDVGNRDRVVAITKSDLIDAVTEIDGNAALRRVERQRLVPRTADQLNRLGLAAVGIEVLGINITATTFVTPSDDKSAVTEAGNRSGAVRFILIATRVRIDLELAAVRYRRITGTGRKLMAHHRPTAVVGKAVRNPVVGVIILPGDDKLAIGKAGYRRLVLLIVGPVEINMELDALLGTRRVLALSVNTVVRAILII